MLRSYVATFQMFDVFLISPSLINKRYQSGAEKFKLFLHTQTQKLQENWEDEYSHYRLNVSLLHVTKLFKK